MDTKSLTNLTSQNIQVKIEEVNENDNIHEDWCVIDDSDDENLAENKNNCVNVTPSNASKVVRSKELINYCINCSCSFKNQDEYKEHIQVFHGKYSLKSFGERSKKDLKNNNKETVTNQPKITKEDSDVEILEDITDNITRDSVYTIKKLKGKVICKICNKHYYRKRLTSHIREVHSKDKFPCMQCEKTFKCSRYLNKHIQCVHEGVLRKNYRKDVVIELIDCKFCSKQLNNRVQLSNHVRYHHGAPADCNICHVTFKNKSTLKYHMKSAHVLKHKNNINIEENKATLQDENPAQNKTKDNKTRNGISETCWHCNMVIKTHGFVKQHYCNEVKNIKIEIDG